jgi:hypothetical protein
MSALNQLVDDITRECADAGGDTHKQDDERVHQP